MSTLQQPDSEDAPGNIVDGLGHVGRVYLWSVIGCGAVAVAHACYVTLTARIDSGWLIFAALTVGSAWLTLRMPAVPVSFSASDTFTFATAMLFGPEPATVLVVLDALAISARLPTIRVSRRRVLFNISSCGLGMAVAARLFFVLAHRGPLVTDPGSITRQIWPLLAFASAYYLLNTGLVARAVAFEQRERFPHIWLGHFAPLWLTYFGGATTAGLIILLGYSTHLNLPVLVLLAPIPCSLYAAFSAGVGRTRDHVAHLNSASAMQTATIETLAQAIDARDQITHDHIRRVQQYAMRLAKELLITNEADLRALEAASLLHDMGKIAVPEHILNKPGKLTRAEFEQMKTHATIGADILSPINFPFPVVPIVRHHHENWDGTGYPAGLRGEAIPLGARILAVVDCFDALTSDRPYRPRVVMDEALRMIWTRRGQMYDPAVVDAFLRIAPSLCENTAPRPATTLQVIAETNRSGAFQIHRADRQLDRDALAQAARLGMHIGLADSLAGAMRHTQLCFDRPSGATLVFFAHDRECGLLVGRCACGPHGAMLTGLTMAVGTRLSGWVAAQRKAIENSDAELDLREIASQLASRPGYCVSVPMTDGDDLVGVLSMYSKADTAFPPHQAVLLETAAALLTPLAVRTAPTQDS